VTLIFVGVLAGVHFYYLHYLRAGLLEPELNTWLIAMVLAAALARDDLRFVFLVPFAWVGAFLTKQTALAFLPLAVLGITLAVLAQRDRIDKRQVATLFGVIGVSAIGLLLLVTDDAYVRTLQWNYQHMFHARESFEGPGPSVWGVASATLNRLFNAKHWEQGVLLVIPVCFPFAVVHLSRNGLALLRRQNVSSLSLLTMTWFVLALGALFAVEHARGRFSHILLPPAFLLFGLELEFWLAKWDRPLATGLAAIVLIAAGAMTHVRWSSEWLMSPAYELRDANRTLSAILGPDDVVVGFRAPLLAFDSEADLFYVKRNFNDSADRLSEFGATHLLVSERDFAAKLVAKEFPLAFTNKTELGTVRFRKVPYVLYELRAGLR
jgi:hypothetical protein